jgi:hypothetical protein
LDDHELTNQRDGVVGFGGENFIAILLGDPIVMPDFHLVTFAYIPAAALIEGFKSLLNAPPGVARVVTSLSLQNIMVGIVFSFEAKTEERMGINMKSSTLFS